MNTTRKPRRKVQLYVWTDFCPDYTSGIAFALAHDEEEARTLIRCAHGDEPGEWGSLTVHDANKIVGYCVSGGA